MLQPLAVGEQRTQRCEPRRQLAARSWNRQGCEQLLDDLHPRLVGDGEVVVAAAEEHGGTAPVDEAGELGRQPRLARSGLTPDEDDLTARPGELP